MFSEYLEREEYEDDLYHDSEEDSGLSADSDVERYLYSQLHYASSPKDATRGSVSVPKIQPQVEETPVKNKCTQPQPQPRPTEVIVIDSGSDGILSSEDDGVCSYKGSRTCLRRKSPVNLRTSSQAVVESPAPKGPPFNQVEVVVLGSDDSSEESSEESSDRSEGAGRQGVKSALDSKFDSEASESDTDSDRLETWMILGQEKHKEDHSIQLNLEGDEGPRVTDNQDSGLWKISQRDKWANISNKTPGDRRPGSRTAARYYTEKSVVCNNCGHTGHLSKNCPKPKKLSSCLHCGELGHFYRDCAHIYCWNCGLPGHTKDVCGELAYWFKQCHRCNMKGHFQDACPQIWRQFHGTTSSGPLCKPPVLQESQHPPYCYNCSQKGHLGFECSQKRMFNGTYPTLPFINYYDKPSDFKRRDHNIQKKVKELVEAGQLPPHPTEEAGVSSPPQKRQRTDNQGLQRNTPPHGHTPQHNKRLQQDGFKHKNSLFKRTPHRKNQPKKQNVTPHQGNPKHQYWRKSPSAPHTDPAQAQAHHNHRKKNKRAAGVKLLLDDGEDFPRGPRKWAPNSRDSSGPQSQGSAKRRKSKKQRMREWQANAQPADENLFAIKQRKPRRMR